MDDEQHGSVRSIGVGINSDVADIGSEVRESLVGGSSEGDIDYFHDHDGGYKLAKNQSDGGFSFPPPRDGQLLHASTGKSLWSNRGDAIVNDDADDSCVANEEMLVPWRRTSKDASSIKSSRDENNTSAVESANSSPSSLSNYGYIDREYVQKKEDVKTTGIREEDPGASLEDEEVVAVQEQPFCLNGWLYESTKRRTGFEEDKNFHVVLNSVIAGRYHVTEYLGSAAFSKAIQAHDLHTGMDEHLLIVCELLKANLYEFHKFNRESGGEVYFTMPRLQSITIQCLEALQFLHSLGLIHCDLKPENILVKSYSRCEVKVIDLGSSCFETDHLCSYVQSRSYRAPEVILGLPYDKKIDIWSLGCILAELCTGNVLFQNDSPATLLARVIGIIGPIEQEMLAKGRDTYKYFTKNHMLYERNQDTNRLEYLIPKKSSLRHRLPMGDQGFIDFVAHLLEVNPKKRPSASEALKHPWLQYPYEPISS
ncbi:UNVERIFIED_CONTAM: putative serine/threonine-protein kinase dyrk2 [Sesamum angustifolium]|uniref:Serine/threonine-protein kinase dyrk2 n=1 Tax=Sesamum angustifolium TaxID=2727405 RepID=A0AAW2LJR8_9LAMI